MYVGWLIDNNLLDEDSFTDSKEAINEFKNKHMTGPQFYETQLDGVLLMDDISETGNRFSFNYFDFDTGQYLNDYEATLVKELPSLYHVQDTWENYEKIKRVMDNRFSEWKKQTTKKSWWKF
jgi:hypothetical protein